MNTEKFIDEKIKSGFLIDYSEEDKRRKEAEQWALGEYEHPEKGCPNCSRKRVCVCDNGKHRCEKCNWVIEDNEYCKFPLDGI